MSFLFPPLLPQNKVLPAKPMPSPDIYPKKKNSRRRNKPGSKKRNKGSAAVLCGDQQDQPRRHPSPNNKRQQLVYPHAIFPEAPKTPVRVGRERSRKGPDDDVAMPAPCPSTKRVPPERDPRRRRGEPYMQYRRRNRFPQCAVVVVVITFRHGCRERDLGVFLFGLGFLLMRPPPPPLPK